MNNRHSRYLCHALSGEAKKRYNKKYYAENKQYWVDWRKNVISPTLGLLSKKKSSDGYTDEEAKKAYDRAQKSDRLRGEEHKKWLAAREAWDKAQKSNRIKTQTSGVDTSAIEAEARKKRWAEIQEKQQTADRTSAKRRAKQTPYASVSLDDLANERNMSKIAKAARSVKRFLNSASQTYKESWKVGARDLIRLGKEIKSAWDNA